MVTGKLANSVIIEISVKTSEEMGGCKSLNMNSMNGYIILACFLTATNSSNIVGVSNYAFFPETQPLGPGSLKCRKIIIGDNQVPGPANQSVICSHSSQNSVLVLNNGCANVFIGDNDGEICIP